MSVRVASANLHAWPYAIATQFSQRAAGTAVVLYLPELSYGAVMLAALGLPERQVDVPRLVEPGFETHSGYPPVTEFIPPLVMTLSSTRICSLAFMARTSSCAST